MRQQDRVLAVIREHPEGITVPEISRIVYPGKTSYAQTYQKARKLEVYGFVTHRIEIRKMVCGKMMKVSVWTPL